MNCRKDRPTLASTGLFALLLLVLSVSAGCVKEYDFERDVPERGTLGEELHRIWKKDAKRAPENPDSKTQMLEQRQAEFVTSVDTIAPGAMLRDIDLFFRELLDLVEEGVLPGITRKITVMLRDAADNDVLIKHSRRIGDRARIRISVR